MDLDEVAERLYRLPREEFTSARDEQAKAARASGDRELAQAISRLRRPTVAAWLVNQLARQQPQQLHSLAELGEALRQAHARLDGEALRELSGRRRGLIATLVRACHELGEGAGVTVSEATERELEEMFATALAKPDATQAVAGGRLSSAKELDEPGTPRWPAAPTEAASPAVPTSSKPPSPPSAPAGERRAAERVPPAQPSAARRKARDELEATESALAEAEQRHVEATRDYGQAKAEETTARQAVEERRAELIAAEKAEREAHQRSRATRREEEDAERALREARRRRDIAQRRLSALEDEALEDEHGE